MVALDHYAGLAHLAEPEATDRYGLIMESGAIRSDELADDCWRMRPSAARGDHH